MALRLLTYNVRYATLDTGKNAWERRRDGVASLVRFHDPDVVCLQEVWQDQLADLRERLPDYEWAFERTSSGEHTPVGYRDERFTALETEILSLSETPADLHAMDWGTTVPRVTTAVRLSESDADETFTVANVHLDHDSPTARERGASLLADRFGDRTDPTVVAGDFNCTPGESPYRELTATAGFRDARDVAAAPHGPEATYNDFEAPQQDRRLDHVFLDEGLDVERFGVLTDRDDRGLYPSDHFAVLAEFEFPT